MQKNYKNLFVNIPEINPPSFLQGKILDRIAGAKMRRVRVILTAFSLIIVVGIASIVPALQYVSQSFSKSGFYSYFSLIFSDGGSIVAYWQEFLLSLADTLPVMGIIVLFSIIFMVLLALRFVAKNSKYIHLPIKFINQH
ncbi:MAG: hypothetical protein WCX95_01775 [Candidatus Gracilibacteria bacterium]